MPEYRGHHPGAISTTTVLLSLLLVGGGYCFGAVTINRVITENYWVADLGGYQIRLTTLEKLGEDIRTVFVGSSHTLAASTTGHNWHAYLRMSFVGAISCARFQHDCAGFPAAICHHDNRNRRDVVYLAAALINMLAFHYSRRTGLFFSFWRQFPYGIFAVSLGLIYSLAIACRAIEYQPFI